MRPTAVERAARVSICGDLFAELPGTFEGPLIKVDTNDELLIEIIGKLEGELELAEFSELLPAAVEL